jgi:hypothetical protein
MPRVDKPTNQVTASTIKENKLFRERLRDRYSPTQWVRVINIDNEKFDWQWFPSDAEAESFSTDGLMRQVEGRMRFTANFDGKIPGKEELWSLDAGESEVLIGECADLMIEGLYKKLIVKKRVAEKPDMEKTQARSFNWNDGLLQEQMIDKIFLGIERPNFDEPRPSTVGTKK